MKDKTIITDGALSVLQLKAPFIDVFIFHR